jgi:hypothetical protein
MFGVVALFLELPQPTSHQGWWPITRTTLGVLEPNHLEIEQLAFDVSTMSARRVSGLREK